MTASDARYNLVKGSPLASGRLRGGLRTRIVPCSRSERSVTFGNSIVSLGASAAASPRAGAVACGDLAWTPPLAVQNAEMAKGTTPPGTACHFAQRTMPPRSKRRPSVPNCSSSWRRASSRSSNSHSSSRRFPSWGSGGYAVASLASVATPSENTPALAPAPQPPLELSGPAEVQPPPTLAPATAPPPELAPAALSPGLNRKRPLDDGTPGAPSKRARLSAGPSPRKRRRLLK